VCAEAAPFVKVGGLGEVMRALPKAMRELGVDARVFVPKYASVDQKKFPMKRVMDRLKVASKEEDPNGILTSQVLAYVDKEDESVAYFLENEECYEKRANVYGYSDDIMRFVLLSRAAIEFVRRSEWKPDFIIANDWMTGFVPNLMRTEFKDDPDLKGIGTLFCIHNLYNQGSFSPDFVPETEADFGRKPITPFFSDMKYLNGMRRGILYADQIITVSPTYAREILSEEYGEKLEGVLQECRANLTGIMNGIDVDIFNPMTDPLVAFRYDARHMENRARNKAVLQEKMGLMRDDASMLLAYNGRLDKQKGITLIQEIIRQILDNLPIQFVLLGDGSSEYKLFFQKLAEDYPGRVAAMLQYDGNVPKVIYAGADAMLMPSKFEPAGLVQMEAMRYGAIPIVRKTGGLADTVEDADPEHRKGTGFVFEKYDAQALLISVVRAYETYRNTHEWHRLIERAMAQDFSWKNSARKYIALCKRMQGKGETKASTGKEKRETKGKKKIRRGE
jgi:starch synthase